MVLIKGTEGYGYKYTDMAQIQKALDERDIEYQQKVDTDQLTQKDYIFTRSKMKDDKEWSEWVRGAKVIEATLPNGKMNPAQQYGSGLSYARRYSLMLYFGIATADDDAECFTKETTKDIKKETAPANTAKQNIAKAIETHESAKKAQQVQIDMIFDLVNKLNLTQEQQQKEMEFFKKTKYVELTEAEANKYIKNLEKRLEVAQNGKS